MRYQKLKTYYITYYDPLVGYKSKIMCAYTKKEVRDWAKIFKWKELNFYPDAVALNEYINAHWWNF